jgi:hypothetical protein
MASRQMVLIVAKKPVTVCLRSNALCGDMARHVKCKQAKLPILDRIAADADGRGIFELF